MKIQDYENLPDYMEVEELYRYCMLALDESNNEEMFTTLEKLDELGNRQWHTYELPNSDLQNRIRNWIINNWENSQTFLEGVLGICYCFGLDKELYIQALNGYTGVHKQEFENNLKNSTGNFINPWWSMSNNAQQGASADAKKPRR